MKLSNLKKSWDSSNRFNNLMLMTNVFMGFTMSVALLIGMTSHERIVLVPPNLNGNAEIAWHKANSEYYKAWSVYISTLIGNITPDNAHFVIKNLSDLMAPEIYGDVRKQLLSMAKEPLFSSNSSISYFSPRKKIYEPATNKVFVLGDYTSTTASSSGQFDDIKSVVLEYQFEMVAGTPLVTYFTTYPGSKPRTLKWKQAHKGQIEQERARKKQLEAAKEK